MPRLPPSPVALALILAPWIPGPGARYAAGQEPLSDTAAVQALLEEATAAFREAPAEYRGNFLLNRHLLALREAWGLAGDTGIEPPVEPHVEIGELVEAGELTRAADRILEMDPATRMVVLAPGLISRLVRAGDDERALAVAIHLRNAGTATRFILDDPSDPLDRRVERVMALRSAGLIPEEDELSVEGQLLALEAAAGFDGAWARTDSIADPGRRVALRLSLLLPAFRQRVDRQGDLFRTVYEEVRALEDGERREADLSRLATLCDRQGFPGCTELALPVIHPPAVTDHRVRAHNAIMAGDFGAATGQLDTLAHLVTPAEVAVAALAALAQEPGIRPQGEVAEEWRGRWTGIALARVVGAMPPVADSLRRFAAPLLARSDPGAAMLEADQIGDPALRAEAFGDISAILAQVDVPSAWEAARRSDHYRARDTAAFLHPIFRAMGDTAAAREALERSPPYRRPYVLLDWAERERRAGRWEAARATAREAAARWEVEAPPESYLPMGSQFIQLGMLEEMTEWARGLTSPGRRATAIMGLVSGMGSSWMRGLPPGIHQE